MNEKDKNIEWEGNVARSTKKRNGIKEGYNERESGGRTRENYKKAQKSERDAKHPRSWSKLTKTVRDALTENVPYRLCWSKKPQTSQKNIEMIEKAK